MSDVFVCLFGAWHFYHQLKRTLFLELLHGAHQMVQKQIWDLGLETLAFAAQNPTLYGNVRISHLWKRKIILPATCTFKGDMLVPWSVYFPVPSIMLLKKIKKGGPIVASLPLNPGTKKPAKTAS